MKSPASWKVACLQLSAGTCWQRNVENLKSLLCKSLAKKPDLVVLPEGFAWRGCDRDLFKEAAGYSKPVLDALKEWSRKNKTALLAGGLLVPMPKEKRVKNTAFFISRTGRVVFKYDKIHLFQVALKNIAIDESKFVQPGRKGGMMTYRDVGVGLSICYDLRFPEYYRRLCRQGAKVLMVPANFTDHTGKAHWRTLLRARAIENQAFVVAPSQSGKNTATDVKSHGHSMVIDPWGRVLAEAGYERNAILFSSLDFRKQERLRMDFPVLKHQRF